MIHADNYSGESMTDLAELEVSKTTLTTLFNAGLKTIEDVQRLSDREFLNLPRCGQNRLDEVRNAIKGLPHPTPKPEKAKTNGGPQTFKEARLQDAAAASQKAALASQQALREREGQFRKLCDDLLGAGNTADELRAYWPEYRSPEERA